MTSKMLLPIAATGFSVAFFHSAIPTHWLPFVVAARAQKWDRRRTLAVVTLAGAGHVLLTTLLGVLIVGLGIELDRKIGQWFPWVAGGTLLLFGLYYLNQQRRGAGHSHGFLSGHSHEGCHDHDHGHAHPPAPFLAGHTLTRPEELREIKTFEAVAGSGLEALGGKRPVSDRAAILGLLAMLTFSPCEGFLPVYLSGIAYGWAGFALLSAILAGATLLGMLLFTWLTLAGLERLSLRFLEEYESGILGIGLCLLGLAVIFFEH